jgi:hypothetical protein
MYIIYTRNKFHTPNSNGPVVLACRLKDEYRVHSASALSYIIYLKNFKKYHVLQRSLLYVISGRYIKWRNSDSSVGIVTGCGLDNAFLYPTRTRDLSFLRGVHTGSGAHPASYVMCTGGSFWEGKAART